jgi:hypothetical protein
MGDGAAFQAERARAGGSFIVRVAIRFSFPIAAAIATERLTLDAMIHRVALGCLAQSKFGRGLLIGSESLELLTGS